VKEALFQLNKRLKAIVNLQSRKVMRFSTKNSMDLKNSFNIPIIINNRNRYTYLLQLITWLENNNYTNIVILDNDSTYPQLLEYYKVTKHKVIFLKKNVGYMALWETDVFEQFKKGFYVYTDPDVIPNKNCPSDIVFKLFTVLQNNNNIEKAGPALRISDLPDNYDKKKDVLDWEKIHWQKPVEKDLYDALVDTTFALYRPFAYGNAEMCKAYRLGGNYEFLHLPWYIDSSNLTDEEKFYRNNVSKTSSYWSSK
jgi:hypothetical protein